MNSPSMPATRFLGRLLSPWVIAGFLVGIFLLLEAYLARQDRSRMAVLNNFPAFATPAFELQFSKKFQWDPLSFTGRGARAGPGGAAADGQGARIL